MSHARITGELTKQEKRRIKDSCRDGVLANGGSDLLAFTGTLFVGSLPLARMMPRVTAAGFIGFGLVGSLAWLTYRDCVRSKPDSLLAHKNKNSDIKEPKINRPGM